MSRRKNMFAELEFLGFDPLCIREALRTCKDFDSALNMLNSNKVVKLESDLFNQGIPKSMAKFLSGTCQSFEEALKKYQEYVPVSQNIRKKCVEMGFPEFLAEKAIDTMMPFDQAVQYIVTTDPSTVSLSASRTISSQRFQNLMQARPPGPPGPQIPYPQPYTSPPMMNQMPPPQYPINPMQYPQPPPFPFNHPPINQYSHPLAPGPPMPYSTNQFNPNIMQGPHPMYNPHMPNPYNQPNIPQHIQPLPHPINNRLPNPPNMSIHNNPPYPYQHPGPMRPPFMSPPINPPPLSQDVPYRVNRASVSIRLDNNNPNDELLVHRDDIGRNFEEAFENLTISRSQRTLDARRMSIARPENHKEEEEGDQEDNQLIFVRIEDVFDNFLGRLLLIDMLSRLYEPQGLNPQTVENLQKVQYSRNLNLNSETCVICYEDYEEGIEIIILKCKHPFHTECISKWLENSTKCPLCKCDLGEDEGAEEE
jgi:hypothetical protein